MEDNDIKKVNKIEEEKIHKRNSLLEAGFNLFMEKGINNTSIQDIVNKANVAKGTFYLYFKDKYDLHNSLIINKSNQLLNEAFLELNKKNITKLDDKVIFIVDYVINQLAKKPILLTLITKNLSIGIYNKKITKLMDDGSSGLREQFIKMVNDSNVKIKNPDITLYMILELVSSTCFSCILKNEPLPINEYKPYLYEIISLMLAK